MCAVIGCASPAPADKASNSDTAHNAASAAAGPCTTVHVDGDVVTSCVIAAANVPGLRIAPAPNPAKRAWTIAALDSTLRAAGRHLEMATNAGIFQENGKSSGLLIREGRELSRLVVGEGPSVRDPSHCTVNFFCLPNAVFYVANGKAHIDSTRAFARKRPPLASITVATQSGPMLVAGGKVARPFPASFSKRTTRNAACVRADGSVELALAENQTHASFAQLLIGRLGCRDALFLDGTISSLYAGASAPPRMFDYGAILYVASP